MMYFKVMEIFHASPHWEELFKFFSWPLVWHFLPRLFQKLSSSWETGLNMGGLLRMKECKYFGSSRNVLIRISYFQEAHRSLWPYHIRVSHLFFERFSSSRPRESWRNGCFSPQSWAWSRVRGFTKKKTHSDQIFPRFPNESWGLGKNKGKIDFHWLYEILDYSQQNLK